jgi:signal transduction histidine kinase
MANNYYKRDSVDKALEYNQRAYKIFEEIGDKAWGAYIRNTMAQIKADKGDFKQALDDYYSSLKVFGEIGDTFNLFTSYQGIAGVYYKQGLYNETVTNLHNALFMAKKTNGANNISSCYENLAVMYDTLKDYKNALANYKLFVGLSDSLFNEKKSQQIAELNTKYETEKKDKDIALLNKDKEIREAEIKKQKLQKYSFIGGLGLVIVLLLFGYRAYRTQQSLRLQSIRNKISGDLHDDIGSTLNSISVYSEVARKKDEQQDEALEMIGEASRKIIEAMSDIVWTINPENDSFEKIIFRMKSLAYNLFKAKKIEFTFHADEILNEKKLSLEERRNFYLIFKEAINNLVKYSNAARVAITLTNENDTIKLSIKDDGVGFEMADDTTGNGLKNMKRRAMEMKAQFNIESGKGNGTQIELTLKA